MKLARLGSAGSERPVLLHRDEVFDLATLTADIDADFLAAGGIQRVREAWSAGGLRQLPSATALRIGPPIARPGAVVCVGMNYAQHAAESGNVPPETPIIFLKPPNTVVGPHDPVTIPLRSTKCDWEVELGVVIGKRASYLPSPDNSLDHVAGFVICNDLSEREFQLSLSGGQWSKGKSFPGFCPTGPWLVTPDELDHHNLRLRSWVNGQPRQDSATADMIFTIEYLICGLSHFPDAVGLDSVC